MGHNGRSCGVVFCAEASHFSGKMSRLVLICGPIVSVACGNLVLQFLDLGGDQWINLRDVGVHTFAVAYPGNLLKPWDLQFGGLQWLLCAWFVKYASLISTTYGYCPES